MRRLAFGPAVLAVAAVASAQPPPPGLPSARVQNVFPPGAKAGTAVEVTVAGTDLEDPTGLVFAHPGLKGEYLAPPTAPTPDPKDPKKMVPPPKAPPPGGPHKFRVTVAADVPPGTHDLRFVGKYGVSNPRAFTVGTLPEVNEKEPNNDVGEALRVDLGTVVNGVISAGTDVDFIVFAGKAGQRVIAHAAASSIDGRAKPMVEVYAPDGRKLGSNRGYRDGDAVADALLPADGDYFVRLSEFTYTSGSPDHVYRLTLGTGPWVDAAFPPVVEPGKPTPVTLYGRNLPGGQPADGVSIDGKPLQKLTVTVTAPASPPPARSPVAPPAALLDAFEYRVSGPGGVSDPVTLYLAREKLVVKKNAGGTRLETAEPIPVPCEVAGYIGRRGDHDWYAFDAKKGDVLMIDLQGERIGTQCDFYMSVLRAVDPPKDAKPDAPKPAPQDVGGGELDDEQDSLHPAGFYTRTTDPAPFKLTAPADGKYFVKVGCRESSFVYGPRTAYRLRVAPPKPDFRAVVMPYSRYFQTGSLARQGGTEALDVFVHRADGFAGPVTVTAEGLPPGVTARPVVIGPAARWGVLTLNVAPTAADTTKPFTVKAVATVAGKSVTQAARPAVVTWGTAQPNQNAPVLARLVDALYVAVRPEKAAFAVAADPAKATVKLNNKDEPAAGLRVKQGEKLTVPVKATWVIPEKPNVTVAAEPMAPNPQQTAPFTAALAAQPTKDKPDTAVTLDVKANAPPGAYSVTLRGEAQVPFAKDPMAKTKPNVPAAAFADPFTVVVLPAAVAKLTATAPSSVKIGGTADVVVKVERLHDFAGEFKVQIELPKGAAGVTAADVVIPTGKDEARLTLKAAADAKPAGVSNAVVRATAVYDPKHTVTHETKVNFSVAK